MTKKLLKRPLPLKKINEIPIDEKPESMIPYTWDKVRGTNIKIPTDKELRTQELALFTAVDQWFSYSMCGSPDVDPALQHHNAYLLPHLSPHSFLAAILAVIDIPEFIPMHIRIPSFTPDRQDFIYSIWSQMGFFVSDMSGVKRLDFSAAAGSELRQLGIQPAVMETLRARLQSYCTYFNIPVTQLHSTSTEEHIKFHMSLAAHLLDIAVKKVYYWISMYTPFLTALPTVYTKRLLPTIPRTLVLPMTFSALRQSDSSGAHMSPDEQQMHYIPGSWDDNWFIQYRTPVTTLLEFMRSGFTPLSTHAIVPSILSTMDISEIPKVRLRRLLITKNKTMFNLKHPAARSIWRESVNVFFRNKRQPPIPFNRPFTGAGVTGTFSPTPYADIMGGYPIYEALHTHFTTYPELMEFSHITHEEYLEKIIAKRIQFSRHALPYIYNLYDESYDTTTDYVRSNGLYMFTTLYEHIQVALTLTGLFDFSDLCKVLGVSPMAMKLILVKEQKKVGIKFTEEQYLTLHSIYMHSYHRVLAGEDLLDIYKILNSDISALWRAALLAADDSFSSSMSYAFYTWMTPIPDEMRLIMCPDQLFEPSVFSYAEEDGVKTGREVWLYRASIYRKKFCVALHNDIPMHNLIYIFPALKEDSKRWSPLAKNDAYAVYHAHINTSVIDACKAYWETIPVSEHVVIGADASLYRRDWLYQTVHIRNTNLNRMQRQYQLPVRHAAPVSDPKGNNILLALFLAGLDAQLFMVMLYPYSYALVQITRESPLTPHVCRGVLTTFQNDITTLHTLLLADPAEADKLIGQVDTVRANTVIDVQLLLQKIPTYVPEVVPVQYPGTLYLDKGVSDTFAFHPPVLPLTEQEQQFDVRNEFGMYGTAINRQWVSALYYGHAMDALYHAPRTYAGVEGWGNLYLAVIAASTFADSIQYCERRDLYKTLQRNPAYDLAADAYRRYTCNEPRPKTCSYLKTALSLLCSDSLAYVDPSMTHLVLVRACSEQHALLGLLTHIAHVHVRSISNVSTNKWARAIIARVNMGRTHNPVEVFQTHKQYISLLNLCSHHSEYSALNEQRYEPDESVRYAYRNIMLYNHSETLYPAIMQIKESVQKSLHRLRAAAHHPDAILSPFITHPGAVFPLIPKKIQV